MVLLELSPLITWQFHCSTGPLARACWRAWIASSPTSELATELRVDVAQFLVAAVALLAVVVAWFQWWTARQKLVLDLFDKQRFQVFLDLRTIASEAIQLGKISRPGQMNEIIAVRGFSLVMTSIPS